MASITQNTDFFDAYLPLLDSLDLHCFWARFFDQPDYDYRDHHFSDDTLCYFRRGDGWIQQAGRPRMPFRAPCLILFRKTQAYSGYSDGPIQANSMHLRCEIAGKPAVSLLDLLDIPPVLPAPLTEPIAPLLVAMTEEFLAKHLASQLMLDGQLRMILAHFLRGWLRAQPSDAAHRGVLRLAPVLAFMSNHLTASLPVEAMAAQVGLSAGHFTAYFKTVFRTTPGQYLIHLKIERARRMLLTSDLTVNQIAHGLGFGYPHYFIRQFKQTTGETPAAYRRANAK